MSVFGGPDIVTDGLVLHLDAANRKSYPLSGSTIYDLSGNGNNANFSPSNGPTFSNQSIICDGSDDFIRVPVTPSELQGNPNLTLSLWVKRLSNESGNTGIWGLGGNTTNQGINSWWYNNANQITIDTWGQATFTTNQTYPLNEWVFVTWQKIAGAMTRSNCILWKNLTSYTGSNLSILRAENVAPNINDIGFTLGRISNTYSVPVNFAYGQCVIYNRILNSSEIANNYNALKGRYGL